VKWGDEKGNKGRVKREIRGFKNKFGSQQKRKMGE